MLAYNWGNMFTLRFLLLCILLEERNTQNLSKQKVRRESAGLGNIHGNRGIGEKKKVYEAKPSSRGFIFSMDETSRHLCVLFWFCVLFFMCQQCWQSLKELCCVCLRKYWCIVLQVGWRKPLNLSLIPCFMSLPLPIISKNELFSVERHTVGFTLLILKTTGILTWLQLFSHTALRFSISYYSKWSWSNTLG